MNVCFFCLATERRKKRLAFYQSSSVVVSPESSPYYPPVLQKETGARVYPKDRTSSPPQLRKEMTSLLSSPDSSPCIPPPTKRAKPLSYSDESSSSSQTTTTKSGVVDFRVFQQRVEFLREAFPEIPKKVTAQFTLFTDWGFRMYTITFSFCFTSLLFQRYSIPCETGSPREDLWELLQHVFTGWMPFLSPSQ